MDSRVNTSDHYQMVKGIKAVTRTGVRVPHLYLGDWIRALGVKQVDIVKATGINEGYLSQLINNRKKNPSGAILLQIADVLGLPMDYLYRLPPDPEILQKLADFDPEIIKRLRRK